MKTRRHAFGLRPQGLALAVSLAMALVASAGCRAVEPSPTVSPPRPGPTSGGALSRPVPTQAEVSGRPPAALIATPTASVPNQGSTPPLEHPRTTPEPGRPDTTPAAGSTSPSPTPESPPAAPLSSSTASAQPKPRPSAPAAPPAQAAAGLSSKPTASPTKTAPPSVASGPAATTETWRQAGAELAELSSSGTAFDGQSVQLARADGRYVASGEATSPIRESSLAFNTAVLSWNADAPEGTSLSFELRVRTADGWSGWYVMGRWGQSGGSSLSGQADRWGRVNVDTLELRGWASALQYRAKLTTANPGTTPALRLVAVVYSDLSRSPSGPRLPGSALGHDLDVPTYSQLDQDPSLMWQVCSPTSLAMVLRYWGVDRTVAETIRGVHDASSGLYGNWPLNTAFAGTQGLVAYVDRFYGLKQLQAEIAAGRPVVASVRWRAGELDNAPVRSAESGHLIVVRGFSSSGDVIVNDPLGRGEGVRRVYDRQQFSRAWLGQGGIVYLIRPG